jgi:arylsulfatase A-like enzyme
VKSGWRYAIWFALAAGLLEAALLVAHGRLIHGFIYLSPHLVWMAPTANLLWFGLGFLLLKLLSRAIPRLASPSAAISSALFLATLSILLLPSQLHRVAALLIAAGVGFQGGRFLTARLDGFDRLVRRSLPLLAASVILLGIGTIGWERLKERKQLGSLGTAREGAPNVILLVLDTVRRASMSLYGYEKPTTPALQRWSARGIRFDHAFSTASWTLPSHASMLTGRWPSEMSAGWLAPLDGTHPMLSERLRAGGYATAGFVANLLYCNRSFGLSRGFIHYEDYRVSAGELLVNSSIGRALSEIHLLRRMTGNYDILGRKSGSSITGSFLDWERDNGDQPYFAFLNYFDAHQPYLPPAELAGRFGPVEGRNFGLLELRPYMGKIEQAESSLTAEEVRAEQNAYDATLAYLDREVDRLLSELEKRRRLNNTIVLITSDHGEQFMEHGLFDHGNSLYRFVTEVPLIILGPGLPGGTVVRTPVSLRDIPATLMDLSGVTSPAFPGRTLRTLWTDSMAPMTPVISETWGPGPTRKFRAIVADGFHAIWSADSAELYEFFADPAETRDLSHTLEGAARIAGLRGMLDSLAGPGRTGVIQ